MSFVPLDQTFQIFCFDTQHWQSPCPGLGGDKVILASSSPVLENRLRRTNHPHPLVYLRGVKCADLSALLDFIYQGEANVRQENLEVFLALAQELELTGLENGLVVDTQGFISCLLGFRSQRYIAEKNIDVEIAQLKKEVEVGGPFSLYICRFGVSYGVKSLGL